MKFTLNIDKTRQEETIVYAHRESKLTDDIRRLVEEDSFELVGYVEREAVKFELTDVYSFTVEDNRIYAHRQKDKLMLRCRLYQLEENLPRSFVRINKSCIANIRMIERFDASVTGTLIVKFKNGYRDSVSRRNVKNVKERLGL